ncbi:hypothetical protein BDN72DRAFT_757173 [Pluteus cervinus]|uniref:Uncharacterized protein n=1 Tax=Pluteus cervinus TaxID=181527 RepID=A0ACD3BBN7_9AGAR|nr:hypothetical protein BDN72DRAFT_757173 [Pluteus cervinus]
MRQIVFYQSGVGAEANFDGDFVPQASVLREYHFLPASKIRDAYGFIAQNFHEGDEIFLFGWVNFRCLGAYTARKLAGLIDKIGLLETQQLGHFFAIWKDLVDGKEPTIPPGTRRTNIRCVGVWDTVGAVFNVIDALHIKDTSLSPSIDYAFHAVSLQENRDRFQPTLWTLPQFGLRNGQVFKEASLNLMTLRLQIWFPGAHTNVGGSYDRHELSDIALFWMVGEILDASLFNLDADFIARTKQSGPDAWGTSQPRNAYNELTWGSGKLFMKAKTRLATNDITRDITFHHSWANAPDALKDPYQMITPKILKETLGAGWMPKYADLNKYEREQKDHWRSGGWQVSITGTLLKKIKY